jgi:hypothetical protein
VKSSVAPKERVPASPGPVGGRAGRSPNAARMQLHHAPEADPLRDASPARARRNRSGVQQALDSSGRPLDAAVGRGSVVEARFVFDLSRVRIHDGAEAAKSAAQLDAEAYTTGPHIVFGQGRYDPYSAEGRSLLAHELTHVAQQGAEEGSVHSDMSRDEASSSKDSRETEAEYAAASSMGGLTAPGLDRVDAQSADPGTIQRKVDMRDVGKGEQSGFARVPELVTRLNAVSTGLTFAVNGSDLTYTVKEGAQLSNFDTQMQGFIDQAGVIPLRFTNRHGLLGSKAAGFHEGVTEDAWSSGYVDIDDLLASSDLGMQEVLVHFLRERTATTNYAKRIGSESLNTDPATADGAKHQAELDRAHAQGIQAELAVLKDFFTDPGIKLIDHDSGGEVFRVYRNSRRDTIRTRLRAGHGKETGVDAIIVEVVTRDGKVHTPEEYKALVAAAGATTTATSAASSGFFFGGRFGHGATVPP